MQRAHTHIVCLPSGLPLTPSLWHGVHAVCAVHALHALGQCQAQCQQGRELRLQPHTTSYAVPEAETTIWREP